MNREQLKAAEQAALEEISRIQQQIKQYRASMKFLDRRDVRKAIIGVTVLTMVVAGLIYKYV